jgi:hypothetical protein
MGAAVPYLQANPLPDDKSSSPTFSYASGRPARMSSFQDDSIVAVSAGLVVAG